MTTRDDEINERAEGNMADVMEHGPRLSTNRSTWIVARGEGRVLRGGCGGMGMGKMWCRETVEHFHEDGSRTAPDTEDPTYADAPFDPGMADDFGSRGYADEAENERLRKVDTNTWHICQDLAAAATDEVRQRLLDGETEFEVSAALHVTVNRR